MTDTIEPDQATDGVAAEDAATSKGPGRRKAWVVGSSTLACAVGGALLGAFAFSAYPGSAPGAGPGADGLASGSVQSPGNSGALCTSWQNTATAADTALSCENNGVSSFTARLARAIEMQHGSAVIGAVPGASAARAAAGHKSSGALLSGLGSGSKPTAPSLPTLPTTGSKTKSTCQSTPAPPSGLPAGSVSVGVSGNGGGVTVKASTKSGIKLCGKLPTAPKLPTSGSKTSTTLPSVPGVTSTKTTRHKKHHSGLSGVVQGVTGGLGGL